MSSNPEADLVSRCQGGDSNAWNELFESQYAATGRFIFHLAPDLTHEDVQEICQETFFSVIENFNTFKGGSRLQTWIFRIASNKARDYRERRNAIKRGGGKAFVPLHPAKGQFELPFDPPSPLPEPDTALMTAEMAAQVGHGMDQLDAPCREVIELRYFADLSYEEIAASLDLNQKTVSSRLSKCLDKLEQIMNRIVAGSDSTRFPV